MRIIYKWFLLLQAFLFMNVCTYAQKDKTTDSAVINAGNTRNSSVNVELLGISRYYSANFEQIYWRKGIANFYVSGGLTFFPQKLTGGNTYKNMGYSLETGVMTGNKRNKLELGIAYTFSYTYIGKLNLKFPVASNVESYRNDKKTYASFKIGYRHYFKNEKLYLRAVTALCYRLTNTYESQACGPYDPWNTRKILPTAGIGIGYSF